MVASHRETTHGVRASPHSWGECVWVGIDCHGEPNHCTSVWSSDKKCVGSIIIVITIVTIVAIITNFQRRRRPSVDASLHARRENATSLPPLSLRVLFFETPAAVSFSRMEVSRAKTPWGTRGRACAHGTADGIKGRTHNPRGANRGETSQDTLQCGVDTGYGYQVRLRVRVRQRGHQEGRPITVGT